MGPLELVVVQSTSLCNLDCSYCYIPRQTRKHRNVLELDDLVAVFSNILSSTLVGPRLHVSWHSGEPLTLSPSYYDNAIKRLASIAAVAPGCPRLTFDIQTNGTLIDDAWCALFREHADHLEVGISCDGPARLHDRHRRNWSGHPTAHLTQAGMERLAAQELPFDVIAVVSPDALDAPEEILRHFLPWRSAIRSFHFNLHDEIDAENDAALAAMQGRYIRFLKRLFAFYETPEAEGLPLPRNIAALRDRILHGAGGDARSLCRPFSTLNVEADGRATTFYAGVAADDCPTILQDNEGLCIGNLLESPLDVLAESARMTQLSGMFEASHAACESTCPYWSVCPGGYTLVKHKRYGRVDIAQTPECMLHVQAPVRAILEALDAPTATVAAS